jgi:hypothetical protein
MAVLTDTRVEIILISAEKDSNCGIISVENAQLLTDAVSPPKPNCLSAFIMSAALAVVL